MASDDEWEMEKEDPCFPIDISWTNIYKCFEEREVVTKKWGR